MNAVCLKILIEKAFNKPDSLLLQPNDSNKLLSLPLATLSLVKKQCGSLRLSLGQRGSQFSF